MLDILLQIGHGLIIFLSSAVGTYGFAIFMHAPRRAWLPASIIGGVSYALYWALLQCSVYEPLSIFLGALLGLSSKRYSALSDYEKAEKAEKAAHRAAY